MSAARRSARALRAPRDGAEIRELFEQIFANGAITQQAFEREVRAAGLELAPVEYAASCCGIGYGRDDGIVWRGYDAQRHRAIVTARRARGLTPHPDPMERSKSASRNSHTPTPQAAEVAA